MSVMCEKGKDHTFLAFLNVEIPLDSNGTSCANQHKMVKW